MEKHILIIEDDKELGELYSLIFELVPYRTTIYNIAPQLSYINSLEVDLLLVDIRLMGSVYNGDTLCRLFKSQYPENSTPFLLLSAEANGDVLAYESGADGFIHKPFDVDELLARVARMIG